MMSMQAMILAAGFATRLRPYSLKRPKPLFPVLNRPLLLAMIERLQAVGFTRIVVNCHYLREQIVRAVGDIPAVIIQEESTILGTGGGLRQALVHLEDKPLLVVNGDIYHDIDVAEIYAYHLERDHQVTMVLHDCPRFNKVAVVEDRVIGFGSHGDWENRLAFTGLQVVNPEVLARIRPGRQSCIIDHYQMLPADEVVLHYKEAIGSCWTDMGSPADYLALHAGLLTGTIPVWSELAFAGGGGVLIDAEARCEEGSRVRPWACIGKACVGEGAEIRRSVVWDCAHVENDARISDSIVTC